MTHLKSLVAACAAVAIMPISANAADLGGNCCADLEERIAELEATTARKGNRKVSLRVYGQVNAGLLMVDAGDFSDERVTQFGSDTDGTFVGFTGNAKIRNDLAAGYVIEIGLDQLGLLGSGIGDTPELAVRRSFFYLKSDSLGGISVGRTGQATQAFDMITTANTYVAAKPLSLQPVSNAYLSGIDLPFDGSNRDVIRYDSPSLAGFTVSASWGNASTAGNDDGQAYDIALRYAGEAGGFQMTGGLGWRHDEDLSINLLNIVNLNIGTGDVETILASGSVKHIQTGLFLSGYYADQDWKDVNFELKGWQLQGGIETKIWASGKSTFYAEYGEVEAEDLNFPLYGLGFVQAIDAAALDLFISYRHYDLGDLINEDADVFMAGAKITF
jgi:predicted porin